MFHLLAKDQKKNYLPVWILLVLKYKFWGLLLNNIIMIFAQNFRKEIRKREA